MSPYTLDNPVLATYTVAAGLATLKMIGHAFFTVHRMMCTRGGLVSPEDLRRTLLNPNPDPSQLGPNDTVDRARRMHRSEGENTPPFLAPACSSSPPRRPRGSRRCCCTATSPHASPTRGRTRPRATTSYARRSSRSARCRR